MHSFLLFQLGYFDGCRDVGGYVDFENERAKQWYENLGFQNMTEQHGYNIMDMSGDALRNYVVNHKPIDKLRRRGVHVESQVVSEWVQTRMLGGAGKRDGITL